MKSLLRPYEERAWGQSNWVLTRFWLGNGFAFHDARPPSVWQGGKQRSPMGLIRSRGKNGLHTGLLHHIAPACPSEHFHVSASDDQNFRRNFNEIIDFMSGSKSSKLS